MSADAHKVPDTTALVPLHPAHAPQTPGPQHLLTPRKQAAFCKALANHGNVRLACRAVSVSPQTAYRARQASARFRQCWDAALVIAREHVEQVLADRAINGVEEKVFYHGEEVATRRRYDSRLLLAHLARLDRKAEERARCEDCDAPLLDEGQFDAALEALGAAAEGPAEFVPGHCSMCSTLAARQSARPDDHHDHWDTDDAVPHFERRLLAMEAALPDHAQADSGMDTGAWYRAEEYRLAAFEAGEEDWWLACGDTAAAGGASPAA